jgi:hypothetical protein
MADDAFLRSSRAMRVMGAVFVVPVLAAVAVATVVGGDAIAPSIVVASLFAYLAVASAFAKWRVGDDGLERRTPLLPKKRIPWDDVAQVYEGFEQGVILRHGFGREVHFSPRSFVGLPALRWRVLALAPKTALTDAVRAVLEKRLREPPGARVLPVRAAAPKEPANDAPARWRQNPFFVLGLSPECSRADVERTGQKLLALLAIESGAAKQWKSPVGPGIRTADAVRAAMAELRDPERRVIHEAWARTFPEASERATGPKEDHLRPWDEAYRAIGWRLS